jgi:hypothetical protein
MNNRKMSVEETILKSKKGEEKLVGNHCLDTHLAIESKLVAFQQQLGNRAVQLFLTQRNIGGSLDIDEETTNRINRQRSVGQPLDNTVQQQLGKAMGRDFSGVRVHISSRADELNRQLGARAFTSGQDVFFRAGAYQPHSSSGRELIAHELTHVVQQGAGRVPTSGSGKMTVRPADDAFEREADAVAKAVTSPTAEAQVQRQIDDEEEEIQTSPLQRQALDEEENIQTQAVEEEEELPE